MPISAEAPWLNYYGAIPRTLNYPRLTIYQLVAQTARECPDQFSGAHRPRRPCALHRRHPRG